MNLTADQLKVRFAYLSYIKCLTDSDLLFVGQKAFNKCKNEAGSADFNNEFMILCEDLLFIESKMKIK